MSQELLTIPTNQSKAKPMNRWEWAIWGSILTSAGDGISGAFGALGGYILGSFYDRDKEREQKVLGRVVVRKPTIWNEGANKGVVIGSLIGEPAIYMGGRHSPTGVALGFLIWIGSMIGLGHVFGKQRKKDMQHDWDIACKIRDEEIKAHIENAKPAEMAASQEKPTKWRESISENKSPTTERQY